MVSVRNVALLCALLLAWAGCPAPETPPIDNDGDGDDVEIAPPPYDSLADRPCPPDSALTWENFGQPYMISWLPIDPAQEFGRLTVPVLVVQGTTDVQVTVGDAERLAKGHPRVTLETIDGMNHVLKEVREASQQTASYSDPTLPLHPRLIESIARVLGG